MERPDTWVLLGKYLSGECTGQEREAVEAWMRKDPSRKQLFDDLRRIWDESAAPAGDSSEAIDLESEWNQLKAQMQTKGGFRLSSKGGSRPRPADRPPESSDRRPAPAHAPKAIRAWRQNWRRIGKGLAIVAVFALGTLWMISALDIPLPETTTAGFHREVVTERGEQASIQLADGTTVTLNVDSRLQIPHPFSDDERTVHLIGEAFFEVETDSTRPFTLETDDATIRVTGTSFSVRGYPDDDDVAVAVAEGGVIFRSHSVSATQAVSELALTAGDAVRLQRTSDEVIKQESVDLESFTAWTDGRLLFEDTPLHHVAGRLERWYDLKFEIQDTDIASLRLTADLKSQSVRNVLDVISATLNIGYRIEDRTVYLTSKAPVRSRS